MTEILAYMGKVTLYLRLQNVLISAFVPAVPVWGPLGEGAIDWKGQIAALVVPEP